MKRFYLCVLACLLRVLWVTELQAEIRLPAILSNNMVLQSATNVSLWGWGEAGEGIQVKTSWSSKTYSVKVRADGRWHLKILTPQTTKREQWIHLMDSDGKKDISGILIGEVWLCSGQSNMDFPIAKGQSWRTGIINEQQEMQDADFAEIRFFHVEQQLSPTRELDDCLGEWKVVTPENIATFSAIAFFYGRDLFKHLDKPIGLIQSTWGGTHAESWTKMSQMLHDPLYANLLNEQRKAFRAYPADSMTYVTSTKEYLAHTKTDPLLKAPKKPQHPNNNMAASTLWNAMIHPLVPYTIRGVIWYQGESNAVRASDYRSVFANMIASWRAEWKLGDFPFYFVQIAPHYKQPPEIRQAQLEVSKRIRNTGMAVITDAGDSTDIHPRNKRVVGERLAKIALAKTYDKLVDDSGPQVKKVRFDGSGASVYFDFVGQRLRAEGGDTVQGFELCGTDGRYHPGNARIQGDKIYVQSDNVALATGVRYGWGNFFRVNLVGESGLPASPFKIEKKTNR